MTKTTAAASANLLTAAATTITGRPGVVTVEMSHFGFIGSREEGERSAGWEVQIKSVRPTAGNRHLDLIRTPVTDAAHATAIIRTFLGRATARDRASLARIAAERAEEARG